MKKILIGAILLASVVITESSANEEGVYSIRLVNVDANECIVELLPGGNDRVTLAKDAPVKYLDTCSVEVPKSKFKTEVKYCVLTGFDEEHKKNIDETVSVKYLTKENSFIFEWENLTFAHYTCIGK